LLRAHHPGTVSGAAFSPRTELLYSASVDGTIRAWDVARRRESFSFRIDGKPLTGLCFEPEGRTLLVTSEHGELWRCEADSGSRRGPAKLLAKVPGPAGDPKLAPGGRFVAWGTAETLTIRDLQLGHEVALGSRGRANRHASWVFAPDGRTLVVSTPNLGIRFFDTATGVDVGQIGTPKDRFGSLAFSADGRELLSSGDRAALHRWVADQPSAGTPANRGRSSRD
jgi:WD40 repeat protein